MVRNRDFHCRLFERHRFENLAGSCGSICQFRLLDFGATYFIISNCAISLPSSELWNQVYSDLVFPET